MSERQLFRESYNININPSNVEVLDKPKLVESQGKQFEAIVVLRNVPVSKYTENLNNRIYRKSLWERVKRLNEFEGIPAFDSHLDNPKPSDMLGVWHNFRVGESYPVADFYVIDERIAMAMKAGIRTLGISTSGYGELAEDGKTVQDESFQIISSDVVWQPSQQVYLSQEQIDSNDQKTESIKQDAKLNETLTNNTLQEGVTVGNDFLIKKQLKEMAKQANTAIKSGVESEMISIREDITSYIEDVPQGFDEQVHNLKGIINKIDETIGNQLVETKKSLQETAEKSTTLESENKTLKTALDEMKSKLVKADEMIKVLQSGSTMTEAMQHDLKLFAKEREVIDFDMSAMREDLEMAQHDIREYERVVKAQEADLRRLHADMKMMEHDLKEFDRATKILESDRDIAIKKLKEFEGASYSDLPDQGEFDRLSAEAQDVALDPAIVAMEKGEGYSESVNHKVKAYYEEAVIEFPFIKRYKDEILKSESLVSATKLVSKLEEDRKRDVGVSLRESTKARRSGYAGSLL